ncbi:glycoside hydrolase family 30 beta sandwich domain-containing protein [Antarcticibacterium flavum]|nr:glycoside hydrolase family 30 beta sandwich domain-containing protein [Antarcticibacterium flavum]
MAFENLDGSKVLVILNESSSTRNFSVIIEGNSFSAQIDPRAVASIVWE